MPTTRRTHICRITNHSQVVAALDSHGWSASKLWNVANYYARQQWDETGQIPDENELKHELKTHPKYNGLHSQSSQKVLEELSQAYSSWFGSDDDRDNGADNIRQKTLPVTPPLGKGDSGNGCLAQPRVIQFSRTRGFQPRAPAE